MSTEVKVPMLPESIADATISTWHKKVGDFVKRDENLVDLETDKVMLEVPAPAEGIIKEILKPSGDVVTANQVIAIIEEGAAVAKEAVAVTQVAQAVPKATEKHSEKTTKAASALSPSVRRAAAELEVDVTKVQGTGRDGRLTKENVLAAAGSITGVRPEQRVPMSRMRLRIAERLLEVKQNTAMLTTFNEINLQAVMDLRSRYKEKFEKVHGARLGFMSFFVKAAVEALKKFPAVNASIDGNDVVYHGYFDIGVAVSTDRGLVVPILRDADKLSMAEIELQIVEYATKARSGKITMEEMQGGTFTLTNGGVFGSLLSTPILNAPQSGILGMHKIEQKPVVENGLIVIRPMMYVALSYDHRIIDGKDSVSYLVAIKEALEDPARMLLEI
jgi:2-oxoglutarate dehydrogenase E2 component (dihydrolipoamide succinyltransferase)